MPEPGLFRERPPLPPAMAAGLFVLLLAGAVVGGACLVRVPETIRCPFVLAPEGGADPLRATSTGYFDRVLAEERQTVRKGQVLFVIRAREMRSWLTDLRSWSTELQSAEDDFASFDRRRALREATHRTAVDIQRAKIQQHERDLAYQRKYLATYQDVLTRYELLNKERLLASMDMLSHRAGAAKAERDVAMAQQAREIAELELKQLESEFVKQTAQEELDHQKTAVRIAGLRRQMHGNPAETVAVKAPFDGVIVVMERKAPGDAVAEGQELCRLARSDSPLVAELTPPEEGMPRLKPGQSVQLFYQAFPYQRFGTAQGTLRWLSPVAVPGEGPARFVARVALASQTMRAGEAAQPLKAGMRGEARVLAGRRTLIEYAFDPIRQLRENFAAPR